MRTKFPWRLWVTDDLSSLALMTMSLYSTRIISNWIEFMLYSSTLGKPKQQNVLNMKEAIKFGIFSHPAGTDSANIHLETGSRIVTSWKCQGNHFSEKEWMIVCYLTKAPGVTVHGEPDPPPDQGLWLLRLSLTSITLWPGVVTHVRCQVIVTSWTGWLCVAILSLSLYHYS